MTEYRWTEEAVDRAKALVIAIADENTDMAEEWSREILDSIKVDPVEGAVNNILAANRWIVPDRDICTAFREAVLSGVEIGIKEAGGEVRNA